jgi:uncharacterized protein YggE
MIRCRAASILVVTLLFVLPAHAQDAPQRVVRVSGESTVSVAPDKATVRFGVVTEAKTAEAARRQNAEAAKGAMNAVRDLGVAENKMQMEGLRLQPRYEYDQESETRTLKGYEATRQVVVELTDLEQLPTLVTRVVQGGANRLNGIDYSLQNRTSVRNDALATAAQNARDKADLLATTLGATLGPVQQIDEQAFEQDNPSPRVRMEMAKARGSDAAPEPDAYAAGEITVRTAVQVAFSLQ